MDFAPSEEQRAVQETFRRFAEREVRPRARELDESAELPLDLFRRAGKLGLFAMRYPQDDGPAPGVVSFVLAVEEIAWGSLALAAACTMQALMGTYFVHRFAPDGVRARLLLPALRGELVGTICMTEPGAGSDLHAIATRAVERGGTWRVTGSKTWITSAPAADFFTVLARTGENALGFFLVERGAEGLRIGRAIDKAGVRGSPTAEVFFEDTAALALGDPAGGGRYLREILAEIRIATAALGVGLARAAREEACRHAGERRQFGRPIRDFQSVAAHLADMAVDVEAARRLTHWAAWRSDRGLANATEAAIAKLFSSEAAVRVCDRAARVCASAAFAAGHPVERYLRDARFLLLGGGTSEILRVAIAKEP